MQVDPSYRRPTTLMTTASSNLRADGQPVKDQLIVERLRTRRERSETPLLADAEASDRLIPQLAASGGNKHLCRIELGRVDNADFLQDRLKHLAEPVASLF